MPTGIFSKSGIFNKSDVKPDPAKPAPATGTDAPARHDTTVILTQPSPAAAAAAAGTAPSRDTIATGTSPTMPIKPGVSKQTGNFSVPVPTPKTMENMPVPPSQPVAPNADGSAGTPETPPLHFLQRIKLFSGLSPDECQQVVKKMKRRDFPPNQVVVREGAPGSSMFFITAG